MGAKLDSSHPFWFVIQAAFGNVGHEPTGEPTIFDNFFCDAVMELLWSYQPTCDGVLIVPREENPTKRPCMLNLLIAGTISCASDKGLSMLKWGLLCVFVTPMSPSARPHTSMDEPRFLDGELRYYLIQVSRMALCKGGAFTMGHHSATT